MKKIRSLFSQISSGNKPDFVIWCFPIIGLLILCLIPLLINENGFDSFDKATISGIAGPIIAFIAALLTFLAFWAQVQMNKTNQETFPIIENEYTDNPVEKRFYELLKIHRTNTSELNTSEKVSGRKVFISLFNEFKCCYWVLKNVYAEQKEINSWQTLNEQDLVNISYVIFFTGTNNEPGSLTRDLTKQYEPSLIEKYIYCLKRLQKKHSDEGQLSVAIPGSSFNIKLKYKPFCGHMNGLENYYRHLFLTAKFIIDSKITAKEKYDYLKILRVQLSGHEQLMLYYNSLTIFGKPWLESNYFTEYRLIKNIPLPLADFGEKPKEKLGEKNSKGELIFELDEIAYRNKLFHPNRSNGKTLLNK